MNWTIVTVVLGAVGVTLAVGGIVWRAGRHLATRADLERFATKVDLERFATKADLEQFAARVDLKFATKADLERFATKADLERFATKADLERFATKANLERFATKADLDVVRAENEKAHAAITENVLAVARDVRENRQGIWSVSNDLRQEIRKNDASILAIAEKVALLAGRQAERDAGYRPPAGGAEVLPPADRS